jgi:hypothetical protein
LSQIFNAGGADVSPQVFHGSSDNSRVSQQQQGNPTFIYPVLGGVTVMPPPVAPIVQYSPIVTLPYELGQQPPLGGGQPMLNQPTPQLLRVVNHAGAEVGYIQLPVTNSMGQNPMTIQNPSFAPGQLCKQARHHSFPDGP